MKRYTPHVPPYSGNANFEEDDKGEWVKYEDVENTWGEWIHRNPALVKENVRLKVLNQEMVEVINGLLTGNCERYEFVVKGRAILAKAWEVE